MRQAILTQDTGDLDYGRAGNGMSLPHDMTTRQYADRYSIPYSTVLDRISKGRIRARQQVPGGIYTIIKKNMEPNIDLEAIQAERFRTAGAAYRSSDHAAIQGLSAEVKRLTAEVEALKKGTEPEWPTEDSKIWYLSDFSSEGVGIMPWSPSFVFHYGVYRTREEAESARDFVRKCVQLRKEVERSFQW